MISDTFDSWVKSVGNNPYLVTLGLLITIGPVLYQIIKLLISTAKDVSIVLRVGLRKAAFRRRLRAIRRRVKIAEHGFFTQYDVSNTDLLILISKIFLMMNFYIASMGLISWIVSEFERDVVLSSLGIYSALCSVAGLSALRVDLQDVIWRKEFQLKNLKKAKEKLERIRDVLVTERGALLASQSELANGNSA